MREGLGPAYGVVHYVIKGLKGNRSGGENEGQLSVYERWRSERSKYMKVLIREQLNGLETKE